MNNNVPVLYFAAQLCASTGKCIGSGPGIVSDCCSGCCGSKRLAGIEKPTFGWVADGIFGEFCFGICMLM